MQCLQNFSEDTVRPCYLEASLSPIVLKNVKYMSNFAVFLAKFLAHVLGLCNPKRFQ